MHKNNSVQHARQNAKAIKYTKRVFILSILTGRPAGQGVILPAVTRGVGTTRPGLVCPSQDLFFMYLIINIHQLLTLLRRPILQRDLIGSGQSIPLRMGQQFLHGQELALDRTILLIIRRFI